MSTIPSDLRLMADQTDFPLTLEQAADEIERLTRERDRLRDALSDLIAVAEMCDDFRHPGRPDCNAYATLEVAKLALSGDDPTCHSAEGVSP